MMKLVEDSVAGDHWMSMEDILLRDQRTTSHRVLDRILLNGCALAVTKLTATTFKSKSSSTKRCCSRTQLAGCQQAGVPAARIERNDRAQRHSSCDSSCLVPASYQDDRGIRSRHNAPVTATTWLRLGSLLVTLLVVSVHGAPTMTFEDRRLSSQPKWVYPCGQEESYSDPDENSPRDDVLLQQVVHQAATALDHAKRFRGDYVRRTFNTDFADWHSTWKDDHYDWLPGPKEIPKLLGEQLEQEYLNKLELDASLLDAYEYLQKFAVGLEQIVWDQEDHNLEFHDEFQRAEYMLRSLLCELQTTLVERGVTLRPDVTREVMPSEYRAAMSSSATYRNLRDWMIFRGYMNAVEYVMQVFGHFAERLKAERRQGKMG